MNPLRKRKTKKKHHIHIQTTFSWEKEGKRARSTGGSGDPS